ncbi:hypothetical protein [Agriterribacter sp.]|uniref:hypothetical protein n=1 Tax=Agriterribacter sp. TaxID=2821509 RepID=UPI002C0739EF|nr:hypothetical protein [Agriterribacter sp.]HRO48188.1 hypothetical protein [Agriterribacter sp.]HRQ18547.1 hypothetical protein [Agriterribacter sp.]
MITVNVGKATASKNIVKTGFNPFKKQQKVRESHRLVAMMNRADGTHFLKGAFTTVLKHDFTK